MFARELLLGCDAVWGERGGLVEGSVMREPLEHFDEVGFGLKFLRAAVCQQGVKEGVVRSVFVFYEPSFMCRNVLAV